jgi:hypothetical protein
MKKYIIHSLIMVSLFSCEEIDNSNLGGGVLECLKANNHTLINKIQEFDSLLISESKVRRDNYKDYINLYMNSKATYYDSKFMKFDIQPQEIANISNCIDVTDSEEYIYVDKCIKLITHIQLVNNDLAETIEEPYDAINWFSEKDLINELFRFSLLYSILTSVKGKPAPDGTLTKIKE